MTAAPHSDRQTPAPDLKGLAGQATLVARALAEAGGDLVLVLDPAGRISHAIAGDASPPGLTQACAGWTGRAWADTVAPDSRAKVERMLRELDASGRAARREINVQDAAGATGMALECRGVRLGPQGPSLVVGRDLAVQSELQQRFLVALAQLEAGQWGLRDLSEGD